MEKNITTIKNPQAAYCFIINGLGGGICEYPKVTTRNFHDYAMMHHLSNDIIEKASQCIYIYTSLDFWINGIILFLG